MTEPESIAVVTGAAGGIGAACASLLASRGWSVGVADLQGTDTDSVVASIESAGGQAMAIEVDVTQPASLTAMVEQVKRKFGGLTAAINSAGVAAKKQEVAQISDDDWRRVIDVNLTGVFYSMRAEIDGMLDQGGSIVNISSVMGVGAFAGSAAYVAAKHGVEGVTKAAALEYAQRGIRINSVAPGFIATELLMSQRSEEERAALGARHPVGRLGTATEVAEVAAFLCSPQAAFVTGSCYRADGGFLTRGG